MTTRKISDLHNWEHNPRSISKEGFERLKKQITKLGIYKPLLITEDGTVLGGNMRLKAYKELGITDVPVSIVDAPTEEKKIEYALSDNDRAGQYEGDQLADLIGNFPEVEWNDYAVDIKPPLLVHDLMDQYSEVVEDEVPEVSQDPPISKLGEIYKLGRHVLMCGDSANSDDTFLLMDFGKVKADMVFTDPPYGVDYEGKTKDKLKIDNDKTTDLFRLVLPNLVNHSKTGASFYVCCPPGNNFKDFFLPFEEYLHLSSTIIWAKNSLVLGHGDYHYQHEPILYGWSKDATHKFYGDRSQTTLWNINRPSASKLHPTMKPIELVSRAIKNSSKEDDIVLDLFGGSGSTLIACEQTNRICYMMELDPKYVDVIRKRYENFITNPNKTANEQSKSDTI